MTKWEIMLKTLGNDLEHITFAISPGDEEPDPESAQVEAANFEVVENGAGLVDTFLPGAALLERAATAVPGGEEWLIRPQELLEFETARGIVQGPRQDLLFEQVTRVRQALARQAPLVLVVDDLQWAEPGSISLLFHLGRQLSGSRILIAGAYRPEEVSLGRDGGRHPGEAEARQA